MKIKIWWGFIPLLILMASFLSSCGVEDGGEGPRVEMYAVRLDQEESWCFLDKEGKIGQRLAFGEEVGNVVNGYFWVREEEDGYPTLYKADAHPKPVPGCEKLFCVGLYNEGLIPIVKENSRISIIDGDGVEKFALTPYKGKEVTAAYECFTEGLLAFKVAGEGWGFYDKKGDIVIEPVYDKVYPFSEGLAVVAKEVIKGDPLSLQYEVINHSGKSVFKLKKDWVPLTFDGICYKYGHMAVKENYEQCILIDKKGAILKLPDKVESITELGREAFIFRGDKGHGLMNYDGDILCRANYKELKFLSDDRVLAKSETEYLILNTEGEKLTELGSYDMVEPLFPDVLAAKEGQTYMLLDYEGKEISKSEFEYIKPEIEVVKGAYTSDDIMARNIVSSDYFNAQELADSLANIILEVGINKYNFGSSPASYHKSNYEFKDKEDAEKSYFYPKESLIIGNDIYVSRRIDCSESIARYTHGAPMGYTWNQNSKIIGGSIGAQVNPWWKIDTRLLAKSLEQKGFEIKGYLEYTDDTPYPYLLRKGDTEVLIAYDHYRSGPVIECLVRQNPGENTATQEHINELLNQL